uniref:Integrase catalytic domain-containing protein n=2 Tax=Physcomitrium patens TaxID=3218 RepID=A0A7I4C2B8_PHYPA
MVIDQNSNEELNKNQCEICHQVRSNFDTLSPQLKPLSMMDLCYYWSLDFVGSLIITSHGAKYMLVMVEHFSKSIELVALL